MSAGNARRLSRAGVAGALAAFAFAGLASVGAAVSPSATPAATEQYEKKVVICHRTGSKKNPFRTIRVAQSAVKAHLRHGDARGPCGSAIFTVCHKVKGKAPKTVKVKGAKKVVKQLRRGDKLGKCKAKKAKKKQTKAKKAKKKGQAAKKKGQAADKPGKGGQKGNKGK